MDSGKLSNRFQYNLDFLERWEKPKAAKSSFADPGLYRGTADVHVRETDAEKQVRSFFAAGI